MNDHPTFPNSAQPGLIEIRDMTAPTLCDYPSRFLVGDAVILTPTDGNDSPREERPFTHAPGNRLVDPAREDGLLDAAELALQHPMETNPHSSELLSIAADPAIACSLFLLLTYLAASIGELGPTARGHAMPGIDRCTTGDLTDDAKTWAAVVYRIVCWAGGSLQPLTVNESDLVTRTPQALVRAAYVLARELTLSHRQAA
jgi:hypothetical protein